MLLLAGWAGTELSWELYLPIGYSSSAPDVFPCYLDATSCNSGRKLLDLTAVPLLKTFEECILLDYLLFLVICELERGVSIEENRTGVEHCVLSTASVLMTSAGVS